MQNNSDEIKELGILANLVYKDRFFFSTDRDTLINDSDHPDLENTYTVIATQNELLGDTIPDLTGFQAFLLQNNTTNEYVIAFRGTEGEWFPTYQTIADIVTDGRMLFDNFTLQMGYALLFVEAALLKYQTLSLDNLTLTGHSLGGSLAELAGYTFGSETYSFNPFGVSGITNNADYKLFLAAQQLDAVGQTDNIHNIVALGGDDPDYLTGVASHILNNYLGEIIYVKDHTGGTESGYALHGMDELNDSISIYNNLLQLFPNEDYTTLTDTLDLIIPDTQQVERFLTSLSDVLSIEQNSDHVVWSESLTTSTASDLGLIGLSSMSASGLETMATNSAYLYALLKLNPFAIVRANYDHLNVDGYLEQDTYSDTFIEDRALFLVNLIEANLNDTDDSDSDIYFNDMQQNIVLNKPLLLAPEKNIIFGSESSDSIKGSGSALISYDTNDHLYGMGGDDTLDGGDGCLEGGQEKQESNQMPTYRLAA